MARYIKKVIEVEAIQNRGEIQELFDWLQSREVADKWVEGEINFSDAGDGTWVVDGPRGTHGVSQGDYLTITDEGFFIPAAAEMFEKSFDLVDS